MISEKFLNTPTPPPHPSCTDQDTQMSKIFYIWHQVIIEPSVDHTVTFYFVKLQCLNFTAQLVASYYKTMEGHFNQTYLRLHPVELNLTIVTFYPKVFGKFVYNQYFVHTLILCTHITLYMFIFFLTIHSMVLLQGKEVCGQN